MNWCEGCQNNGEENGGFTVNVEDYFVHDQEGKLVRVASAELPLCLLLRIMVRRNIDPKLWPDRSDVVVRHDKGGYHAPSGYAYAGHDGNGTCNGRDKSASLA